MEFTLKIHCHIIGTRGNERLSDRIPLLKDQIPEANESEAFGLRAAMFQHSHQILMGIRCCEDAPEKLDSLWLFRAKSMPEELEEVYLA
jgi:hypothetical protein